MTKKTFTFLVVSNRRGGTKSFTISAAWLKAVLTLGTVLSIILIGVGLDYISLLLEASENKKLKAENLILKQQFDVVESKLATLEEQLEHVKSNWSKLKLITNIEDTDRTTKLALGPAPKPGQDIVQLDESTSDKEPAAEFSEKENVFFEQAPLDPAKRELVNYTFRDYSSLSIRIDRALRESQLREQGVISLYDSLVDRQALLNATPNIKPAIGWYTSRFGYRIDPFTGKPVMHAGLDIAGSPGTPVVSPAEGVVSYVGYEPGYGKIVAIDHGYGVRTRFGHNSQVFVHVGQRVSRRDVISAIGNTGRSSGPHVHYEVRVNGLPVDPANYILDD